ncbi:hypothetical protein [Polaribacter sp.]|uniref:hypothetical protein n=1 Tax=Polaribacter sp. TaxID=1920175 RepID=UPI003F6B23CA
MKKLFILFAILTLTNLNAQEKQNDATLEETISFIKKYKHHINGIWLPKWYNKFGEIAFKNYTNTYIKDSGNYLNMIIESKNKKIDKDVKVYLDLTKLRNSSNYSTRGNEVIVLNFIGKYCFVDEYNERNDKKRNFKGNFVRLSISNSEMRPRLAKAFNHLAYLMKKKRLEKQKNSGDKF